MADAEIKLVISADNADAIKKVQEFAKSLDGVSVSTDKTKKSQEDLATSVFKGTAAWDILKTGLKEVEGFVVDSAKAFIEAEGKMSLVKNTVESLGIAYASVQPQIEAFMEKMSRLGVDDEDAALSMAKLSKSAGGDFKKGMELAKMAADLTASGIGDLASNTDNLQKILIGKGARALLEYRINLSDTATTAEQLDAVQKKVTRTTEEYANTTEGKVKVMQEAFMNLKEEIGQGLVLALQSAMSAGKDFNGTLDNITEASKQGKAAMFSFTNMLIGVGQGAITAAKGATYVATELWNNSTPAMALGLKTSKEFSAALADDVVGSLNSTVTAFKNVVDPIGGMQRAQAQLEAQNTKTGESATKVGDNIKNANKASAQSIEDHKQKVLDLKTKYDEATSKISDDLSTLETNHKEKMDSIVDSIAKAKQSLKDLEDAYNQTKTDDTQSVADKIVESEKKVAELQKQINEETSADKRTQLQKDLDEEQKNLTSASQWKINNAVAITEAERRAGLTDLQRTIEDYTQKRILADKDYQEKKARLEQELVDLDDKNKKEIAMYADKVAKISEQMDKETAAFKKNMAAQKASVEASITAQIDLYNRLAAAKAAAGAGGGVISGGTVGLPLNVPKMASGGVVDSPTLALIGEAGPEAVVPLEKMNTSKNPVSIVVNINGGNYLSHDAAEKIGDMIINKLRMQMRI